MATKNIVIHVDDIETPVVLKSARKEDGIRRAELMLTSLELPDSDLRKQVAFYQYPTCVCAVLSPTELKDLSFSDFLSRVDEADIDTWSDAAYELNPQWKKSLQAVSELAERTELSEEDEKKTGKLLNG